MVQLIPPREFLMEKHEITIVVEGSMSHVLQGLAALGKKLQVVQVRVDGTDTVKFEDLPNKKGSSYDQEQKAKEAK